MIDTDYWKKNLCSLLEGGLLLSTRMGVDTDYWNRGLILTTLIGNRYWVLEWGNNSL